MCLDEPRRIPFKTTYTYDIEYGASALEYVAKALKSAFDADKFSLKLLDPLCIEGGDWVSSCNDIREWAVYLHEYPWFNGLVKVKLEDLTGGPLPPWERKYRFHITIVGATRYHIDDDPIELFIREACNPNSEN